MMIENVTLINDMDCWAMMIDNVMIDLTKTLELLSNYNTIRDFRVVDGYSAIFVGVNKRVICPQK
jgi:hypothetical protein